MRTPGALTIKQNIIWNSAGSIVNLSCQWLMSIIIVRLSNGYNAAGVFALASSIYSMFAAVGQYRMKTYQISDVRHENSTGEYLAFRFITCGIALVLCAGYSFLTCTPDSWAAILLFACWKSASLIIEVLHANDQIHGRMDYIGQSLALQGVGSLIICSAFLASFRSLELALLAMTIYVTVLGIVLDLPRTLQFGSLEPRICSDKVIRLLARCFPIVLAGIAVSSAPSLPRQLLSAVCGAEALGIYASIASPIAIIQMSSSYIYGPLLTTYSLYFARGEAKNFNMLLVKTTATIALVGLGATFAVIFFGEPLLVFLYGESIREYTYLMIPMVPFAVITGYMWFINDLLISVREFHGSTVGGVLSLLAALAVMFPLIDHFGMNGVTYTGMLSCAMSLAVMMLFLSLRLRSMKQSDRRS